MDSLNPQVPIGDRKNLHHLERIKTQQSVAEDLFDYNDVSHKLWISFLIGICFDVHMFISFSDLF